MPRRFDAISCPGGREFEFDHRSLPGAGAFDHHSLGVGNLIASLHFMSRVPLIPRELTNHCGDSKETIADYIRGRLVEGPTQAFFRTILIEEAFK